MSEVVKGTISRVEPYGLYAETPKGLAIVLLPDVSEEKITDLTTLYQPGDSVMLKLLYFAKDRELYKASMLDVP